MSNALCLVPTPTPGALRAPPLFRIALLLSFFTLEPSQRPRTGMYSVPASSSPREPQLTAVLRINQTPQTMFTLGISRPNWVVFYCGHIKSVRNFTQTVALRIYIQEVGFSNLCQGTGYSAYFVVFFLTSRQISKEQEYVELGYGGYG